MDVDVVNDASPSSSTLVIRGRPKSGRVWKGVQSQRFTALAKDKKLHSTWDKKVRLRTNAKTVSELKAEIKMARQEALEEKKRKREEKRKRKEENERKAEIVQVINNSAKLKRLKKKQLRKIEKRDTNPVIAAESASA